MYSKEIAEYERLRKEYEAAVAKRMGAGDLASYNEILFSTHSCAIEGNSFTIDDTRELKEKGLAMVPVGRSLLEACEMLDHFDAYEYTLAHLDHPLNEELVKEMNRRATLHTLPYHQPEATPGEYTDTDMAAGDTVFGDHEKLVAQVPRLLSSTEQALAGNIHPMVIAARFHGFFEYLHPFRDGNGRTGRLLSNHILLRKGHPLLIIPSEERGPYIAALRAIRTEGTDEHLVRFFFKVATTRFAEAIKQKRDNTRRMMGLFF